MNCGVDVRSGAPFGNDAPLVCYAASTATLPIQLRESVTSACDN
jgi:hypothetical protein